MSSAFERNQAVMDYETIAGPPQGLSDAEKITAAIVSLSANVLRLNNTLCDIRNTLSPHRYGANNG